MNNTLYVSLIQSEIVWENPVANREHFGRLIDQCSDESDIIILPEMFSTGFSMNAGKIAEKFGEDMLTLEWMKTHSKNKQACICGSVAVEDNGQYYNRLIWVNPDGSLFYYDKRHLFSFAGEDQNYTAGSKKLIIEYKGWKICPLICYDLRFPVWSRNQITDGKAEYDLLIYVANWPEVRKSPWEKLLFARAIENQCYLAAVNRIGSDGNGHRYSGESMILNSKGEYIDYAPNGNMKILSGVLSRAELNDFREKFPVLGDADDFEIK